MYLKKNRWIYNEASERKLKQPAWLSTLAVARFKHLKCLKRPLFLIIRKATAGEKNVALYLIDFAMLSGWEIIKENNPHDKDRQMCKMN